MQLYDKNDQLGLLDVVRRRYEGRGANDEFSRVVGDGTLWLALLIGLSTLPWQGKNAGFERALCLSTGARRADLLSSQDVGHMAGLLNRLDEKKARAVQELAPKAINLLDCLETILHDRWDSILSSQAEMKVVHEVADLLWRGGIGWAVVLESAPWDSRLRIYLHLKATDIRVAPGFYINVSKAGERDCEIKALLDELASTE